MADRTDGDSTGGRSRLLTVLPWVVVGVVMVVLAAVAVVRLFMTDEDPGGAASVQDVADLAVVATEAVDLAGGLALLCDEPMRLYPDTVDATLKQWRGRAGSEALDLSVEVSDVDEGPTGSFVIAITSPESGLEDVEEDFRVFVESRDGRSCVTGVGGVRAQRPSTRFSGDGYVPVTSPPPSPATRTP